MPAGQTTSRPLPERPILAERCGDEIAAWVAASCARQGVPVKVTDAAVVARAVTLLSGGALRPAASRARAGLQAPDGIDPVGVEGGSALGTGPDEGVVEHRGHDGVLAGEVEFGPLSA